VPETGVAAEVVMMEVITTTMWLEGIQALEAAALEFRRLAL